VLGLRRLFGGWVVSLGRKGVVFLKPLAEDAFKSDEFLGFWLHSAPAADTNVPLPNILSILSYDHPPDALKPG
jgi:hypothetical protein